MRPAKPKAAAPPRILTALEAAPLGVDEVLAEGWADEVEEGEVADEAPGDVDVGGGTEEVRVTPAAAHVSLASCKAFWRSLPLQLELMH